MSNYDICIIGGGISGLYTAYQLINTKQKIIILEAGERFGGRIQTYTTKDYLYECGAGRISEKHKLLMKLIKELKLDEYLYELDSKINIVIGNKSIKYNPFNDLKNIIEKSKKYTKKYLTSITFFQLCIDIIGFDNAQKLKYSMAYDAEFNILNAHACLKMYKDDLFIPNKYFILTCGLESIITKIIDKLMNNNIELKNNAFVTDVTEKSLKYRHDDSHHNIKFSKCICCIPSKEIQNISIFKDIRFNEKIIGIPLLRIYAKYPLNRGKVWFHNLPKIITDNYIRFIIPIDVKNGIIMISYTDSMYSEMWNNLSKNGNKYLYSELHKQIKEILDIEPPKPLFIRSYFWKEGFHNWLPENDINKEYEYLQKPFEDKNIYLCNESFSKKQGWIEGSLQMSSDICKQIISKQKGGAKTQIPIFKNLDSIIKHTNWIILEIGKKYKVFDVSKWISKHPGGRDNILKGIKANHFYKDMGKDKKYPDPPIKLFKQISKHLTSDVIQNFLPKEYNIPHKNSGIVLVGLFKIK